MGVWCSDVQCSAACTHVCVHVCVRPARMDVHHHLDLDEYNMSFYEMVVVLLFGLHQTYRRGIVGAINHRGNDGCLVSVTSL